MVSTVLVAAAESGTWQERTALPSRCTVHAPHCPRPHPNFVPVNPIFSRSTQSQGVVGLASTLCCLPFTVRDIILTLQPVHFTTFAPSRCQYRLGHAAT